MAKIRNLNSSLHILEVFIFPQSHVKKQESDNTMFQAELPQNIWNANYCKTYSYPGLTSKAWSLALEKSLGLLLGHT